MRLFALRGATSVEANEAGAILDGTSVLMRELMERNALAPEAMVSCIFTLTDDLDAEFPAVAARALGLDRVPLLCAREVPVPGALPRVIRVLLHYYAPEGHRPQHVYLGAARALRSDLEAAQRGPRDAGVALRPGGRPARPAGRRRCAPTWRPPSEARGTPGFARRARAAPGRPASPHRGRAVRRP